VTGPAAPAGSGAPARRRLRARPAGRRPGAGAAPLPLLLPALIGMAFLLVPLLALLIRAPWRGMPDLLTSSAVWQALRLSLETATLATAVALVLGVPLAWLLARTRFPGRRLVRALVTLPLVLPPVVGGVALLLALGRNGVVGSWLDSWFGVTLPFTTPGVVVAEAFVAMPFLVISVEGTLRAADARYEEAAATLGASRFTAFRRVTLPLVAPGVAAGAVLAWARALGEFGATITFAGSFPGRTQTMPLSVYLALQDDPDTAVALSLVLLAVSVAVLLGLRERWTGVGVPDRSAPVPAAPAPPPGPVRRWAAALAVGVGDVWARLTAPAARLAGRRRGAGAGQAAGLTKSGGDAGVTAGVTAAGASGAPGSEAVEAGLRAHLVVDRGDFRLDVELAARPGEVLALLGPNGAGKTTSLRALAGLTPLTGGELRLDGRVLEEPARRTRLAPEHRPVGVIFQDYLLFPHLSAAENVAFGPRCHGVPRARARADAAALLERLNLAAYGTAKPRRLSGGQAQRVALARALATAPRLLLLDEPLAALDAGARLDVRAQLRRHLAAFEAVAVLVTHDPLDAMVLADRLVVVEGGRVVQTGTPAEIARRPRTDYVARLVGLNLYRGEAAGRSVRIGPGLTLTGTEPLDGPAFVAFPPGAVALHRARPGEAAANAWAATVEAMESHGHQIRVALTARDDGLPLVADLTAPAVAELGLHEGAQVWATVATDAAHAYPA